jgi:sec-independent protein translocase protein TatB
MIDLGLTKLALIGGVAIVVIGPARLPEAARVTGRLFGRAQSYLSKLKAEINEQMQADALKAQKNALSESADILRSVGDDLAKAEEDFSAAILDANRSFERINEFGPPVSDDDIRQKQRMFTQKKRHYISGPPVWYQRTRGSRVRLRSSAARSRDGLAGVSPASRFFQ